MKKGMFLFLLITFIGTVAQSSSAQATRVANSENSIFYEVSGNGLKESSYLFGTFHLLTSSFVDSMPFVMEKFKRCRTIAGELKIDSTIGPRMMAASMMKDVTLDKLLSEAEYESTAAWLKQLTGYDLAMFNQANPMTISAILTAYVQKAVFPELLTRNEMGMDAYFQTLGTQEGKKVMGLETLDDQIHALYSQFTLERQAELLMDMVDQKKKVSDYLLQMLTNYKAMNLGDLMKLMYDESFSKSEIEVLVDHRNISWMGQLPTLMKESPVFVAVGALHLGGQKGLVQLLRNAGYTVKPINS